LKIYIEVKTVLENKLILWLVISPPLKNMSWSVGMMKFPMYGKMKFMFQTTNQYLMENDWFTRSGVLKPW